MAILGRSQPNPPVIVRSTLEDPPVLTTAEPVVVTHLGIRARPAWGQPNQSITVRNTLADPPVVTTPAPLVVTSNARRPVNPAVILRSSTEDAAVVTAATPQPIVVVPPARRSVVPAAILARGSLEDFATPQPLVVAAPTKRQLLAPPIVLRSGLADLPLATEAIPPPLVVVQPAPRRAGVAVVLRAPVDPTHICSTTRPFTGVTLPPAGVTARPFTGVTEDPC